MRRFFRFFFGPDAVLLSCFPFVYAFLTFPAVLLSPLNSVAFAYYANVHLSVIVLVLLEAWVLSCPGMRVFKTCGHSHRAPFGPFALNEHVPRRKSTALLEERERLSIEGAHCWRT